MKLIGAITNGSGPANEDGLGYVEQRGRITVAWVIDGVTGINITSLLDVPSEPAWFAATAEKHLREIASQPGDVLHLLTQLVPRLEADWHTALAGRKVPDGYDLPAACLTLVKLVNGRWQGLRLGDSYVLSKTETVTNHAFPLSNLPDLEAELKQATAVRRAAGVFDMKTLLGEFRPRLQANRRNRNTPGSYSILVPHASALAMPQVIDIGSPDAILLCTDGFYRAVDIYGIHNDVSLFAACQKSGGVEQVLAVTRAAEAQDPACEAHARFKPADDATAVMLAVI